MVASTKVVDMLQEEYGMISSGSYKQQFLTNIEKAAANGDISLADYHENRLLLNQGERTGLDDGKTRSRGN